MSEDLFQKRQNCSRPIFSICTLPPSIVAACRIQCRSTSARRVGSYREWRQAAERAHAPASDTAGAREWSQSTTFGLCRKEHRRRTKAVAIVLCQTFEMFKTSIILQWSRRLHRMHLMYSTSERGEMVISRCIVITPARSP